MNRKPRRSHRLERVTVRLTADERRTLEERAAACDRSLSVFMREASLGAVPRRSAGAAGRETRYHLGRIGNNLNQLAHLANSSRRLRAERELLGALAELRAILKEIAV